MKSLNKDLQQIKDSEILKQKKEEIAECVDSYNIPSCLYCEEFEHCLLQIDYTRTVASLIKAHKLI